MYDNRRYVHIMMLHACTIEQNKIGEKKIENIFRKYMFVNFVQSVKNNILRNLVAAATPPLCHKKNKHFPNINSIQSAVYKI